MKARDASVLLWSAATSRRRETHDLSIELTPSTPAPELTQFCEEFKDIDDKSVGFSVYGLYNTVCNPDYFGVSAVTGRVTISGIPDQVEQPSNIYVHNANIDRESSGLSGALYNQVLPPAENVGVGLIDLQVGESVDQRSSFGKPYKYYVSNTHSDESNVDFVQAVDPLLGGADRFKDDLVGIRDSWMANNTMVREPLFLNLEASPGYSSGFSSHVVGTLQDVFGTSLSTEDICLALPCDSKLHLSYNVSYDSFGTRQSMTDSLDFIARGMVSADLGEANTVYLISKNSRLRFAAMDTGFSIQRDESPLYSAYNFVANLDKPLSQTDLNRLDYNGLLPHDGTATPCDAARSGIIFPIGESRNAPIAADVTGLWTQEQVAHAYQDCGVRNFAFDKTGPDDPRVRYIVCEDAKRLNVSSVKDFCVENPASSLPEPEAPTSWLGVMAGGAKNFVGKVGKDFKTLFAGSKEQEETYESPHKSVETVGESFGKRVGASAVIAFIPAAIGKVKERLGVGKKVGRLIDGTLWLGKTAYMTATAESVVPQMVSGAAASVSEYGARKVARYAGCTEEKSEELAQCSKTAVGLSVFYMADAVINKSDPKAVALSAVAGFAGGALGQKAASVFGVLLGRCRRQAPAQDQHEMELPDLDIVQLSEQKAGENESPLEQVVVEQVPVALGQQAKPKPLARGANAAASLDMVVDQDSQENQSELDKPSNSSPRASTLKRQQSQSR